MSRVSRVAARVLLDLGVGWGDHVFVMLPRVPEWYAALFGAMRIGAVPMPAPNLLTAKDIACLFEHTGASVPVTDDPLLLYFTSGTVSDPKMIRQSHSYALGHIGTARFWQSFCGPPTLYRRT